MRLVTAAILTPLLIGCASVPGARVQPSDASAAASAFAKADAVYLRFAAAYRKLDSSVVRRIYTPDCSYLQPSPRTGIEDCEAALQGFRQMFESAATAGSSLDIAFKIARRRIYDNAIVDTGYYRLRSRVDAPPGYGKFVVVMEPDATSGWRFAVDGYSIAPAAAFETLDAPILEAPPST